MIVSAMAVALIMMSHRDDNRFSPTIFQVVPSGNSAQLTPRNAAKHESKPERIDDVLKQRRPTNSTDVFWHRCNFPKQQLLSCQGHIGKSIRLRQMLVKFWDMRYQRFADFQTCSSTNIFLWWWFWNLIGYAFVFSKIFVQMDSSSEPWRSYSDEIGLPHMMVNYFHRMTKISESVSVDSAVVTIVMMKIPMTFCLFSSWGYMLFFDLILFAVAVKLCT